MNIPGSQEKHKASSGKWESKHLDAVLIFTHNQCEPRAKIAAFDMDGSLVSTKSGRVYPVNNNDWRMTFNETAPRIKKLYDEQGYKIVIFTNQKGIQVGIAVYANE
ncbi:unnamed protein product [Strongylus vulgaris]|uniref:Uncharacterized protein n=1 Tax=Strongylus vulgaris TaxID=40348 RepID=A0A3P7J5R8_STRVU|nr:unnamed protein product [Strongylus vulgaris]